MDDARILASDCETQLSTATNFDRPFRLTDLDRLLTSGGGGDRLRSFRMPETAIVNYYPPKSTLNGHRGPFSKERESSRTEPASLSFATLFGQVPP